VRSEVFGKLDAARLLLPELEVAVGAGGDEEVGALGGGHGRQGVAVHVASLVHLGQRQRRQVLLLELQHLRLRRCG
jgi:hypothetical protein